MFSSYGHNWFKQATVGTEPTYLRHRRAYNPSSIASFADTRTYKAIEGVYPSGYGERLYMLYESRFGAVSKCAAHSGGNVCYLDGHVDTVNYILTYNGTSYENVWLVTRRRSPDQRRLPPASTEKDRIFRPAKPASQLSSNLRRFLQTILKRTAPVSA